MRQIVCFLLFFSCCLAAQERPIFSQRVLTSQGWITRSYWGDEIVVQPKGYASLSAKSASRHAMSSASCDTLGYCYVPFVGDQETLTTRVASLRDTSDFYSVSLSPVIKARQAATPEYFSAQWQLSGTLPASIGWQQPTQKADNIYIVGLDTGINFGHEAFDWSHNEIQLNYNAIQAPLYPSATPDDDNGHGTAVLSIAVASKGKMAGVAPFAKFGAFKVLDSKGNGDTKTIVSGLLELATRVKNLPANSRIIAIMAFGATEEIPAIEEAMQVAHKAGVIFVVAAGNDGLNADLAPQTPTTVPFAFSIAASNTQNQLVANTYWASTYGPRTVFGSAPGVEIVAAVPKPIESSNYALTDPLGYKRVEGTSFAAPHYAGAMALELQKHPDMSEDQLRIRMMNGNRKVMPVTMNKRVYQGQDLFISGASLYLPTALAEDTEPPAQPTLEVIAGHSSVVVSIHGTEKPFGIRCYHGNIGNQKTWEAIPYFGTDTLILRNQDGSPLPPDTAEQTACQTTDAGGNWSALSLPASFKTLPMRAEALDPSSLTPEFGPLGDDILALNPNTRVLWHQTQVPTIGNVWYSGTDTLNYFVGNNDSVLESDWITLPLGSVSLDLKKFVQMIGKESYHFDRSEVSVYWEDDSGAHEKVLVDLIPNNTNFGLEDFRRDITEFSGKILKLRFRFFTNGSSVGIGWILGPVSLEYDDASSPAGNITSAFRHRPTGQGR